MRILVPLSLLSLAATVMAQSYSYSPPQYANVEAANNNTYPWGNLFRYQQIDGNLGTQARLVTGIAWRRDATLSSSFPSRSLELELLMCQSSLAGASTTFANNYIGTPQVVFTKKFVNTPDWSNRPNVAPAPFDFALQYDTPYVYLPMNDVLWEAAVTSVGATSTFAADAATGTATTTHGSYALLGSGCTTAAGTYELRSSLYGSATTGNVTMTWNVQDATASANSTLLIGFTDPNLADPGLCAPLHTDGLIQVSGTTSSSGSWNPSAGTIPLFPQYVGVPIYAQAVSVDGGQPGLPVALSNGLVSRISDLPQPVQVSRVFASGNPAAATGTLGANYGLVTRYQH